MHRENTSTPPRLIVRYPWGKWVEKKAIKWTGYSIVSAQTARFRGTPYPRTLLLTTIGRRSGQLRETALPYYIVGRDFVVIGSFAGGAKDPQWIFNLRTDPRCWIHVKRRSLPGTARVLTGAERAEVLARCIEERSLVASYERSSRAAGREMPVVAIRPTSG